MPLSMLVQQNPLGLYCPPGDFYIDPLDPVPCAVLTHAHSDHARSGSGIYHATRLSQAILHHRLGPDMPAVWHEYGERFTLGAVTVSLHPAGHILGSAQIRIEHAGEVWVVTGDYKRQSDGTCAPFETLRCDGLVTEATFALPIYKWPETEEVASQIFEWWQENKRLGRNSLVGCYALGKAQRLLYALKDMVDEPIHCHGAVDEMVQIYRQQNIPMAPTVRVVEDTGKLSGALILAPPSALGSPWARRFTPVVTAFASGWMQIRGNRRRKGYDRGFVLSDHADWDGLLRTVKESGARHVLTHHGYSEEFARYLREQGLSAEGVH